MPVEESTVTESSLFTLLTFFSLIIWVMKKGPGESSDARSRKNVARNTRLVLSAKRISPPTDISNAHTPVEGTSGEYRSDRKFNATTLSQ